MWYNAELWALVAIWLWMVSRDAGEWVRADRSANLRAIVQLVSAGCLIWSLHLAWTH